MDEARLVCNRGKAAIAKGTTCIECKSCLDQEKHYVRRVFQTRLMAAPAFWYYHVVCYRKRQELRGA